MKEKNVILDDFNSKQLIKKFEAKKALCPSCEKKLKYAGSLYLYHDKKNKLNIFYSICRKCEYKKEKLTKEQQDINLSVIEERLQKNTFPYTCEIIEDPNIDRMLGNIVNETKDLKINGLVSTTGEWHVKDQEFFDNNPNIRFYARPIYEGELEITNSDNPYLQQDAINKNIKFAVIHHMGGTQRIYSFVSDLTGHPYNEEAFVAALFMIRVNKSFTPDDLYPLYEKIKENYQIIKDFKLNK